MSSNPMQRKVRNSFFLGVLSMLLVVALVATMVFLLVIKPKLDKEKEEQQQIAYVYRLKKGEDVKSGDEITSSMVECVEIQINSNATDYIKAKSIDSNGNIKDLSFTGGYKSKIDLTEGTILTKSMLNEVEEEEISDSLRYVEYNMISMPTTLNEGDYVDIRLRLPNAQDLIVISKKQIVSLYDQTIGLNLKEEEILIMNSAIVEAYIMSSAELYIATYVEPGLQETSTYTYSPTAEVVNLIEANPNITKTARDAIANKYAGSGAVRNPINNILNQYSSEAKYNVESGIQEQIESARKAREKYLSELNGD